MFHFSLVHISLIMIPFYFKLSYIHITSMQHTDYKYTIYKFHVEELRKSFTICSMPIFFRVFKGKFLTMKPTKRRQCGIWMI